MGKGTLPRLVNKQNGLCIYCREPIVIARDCDEYEVVEVECGWVRYRSLLNGHFERKRQATIEHIKPRSLGGTNAEVNLAAACFGCNNDRSKCDPPKEPALENHCRWCLCAIPAHRRLCDRCNACRASRRAWNAKKGPKKLARLGIKNCK